MIVQREAVRQLLSKLDPEGTAQRWSALLKRRVYSVPTPNYLWHLDSNHKLIRYVRKFAIYEIEPNLKHPIYHHHNTELNANQHIIGVLNHFE